MYCNDTNINLNTFIKVKYIKLQEKSKEITNVFVK